MQFFHTYIIIMSMGEILENLYNLIMEIISSSGWYGPLLACLLIFFESMIPILPLFVFITIVFEALGYVIGFIISYILTCLGCCFSFFLVRKLLKNFFTKKFRKNVKLDKIMKKIDEIDISYLTLLIALPFTPAFLVNIAAALSEMKFKKFLIALLIGKISLIFFWGFIGTSLLDSLKNPKILVIILIMLGIAYLLSKLVTKKLDMD